jgi:stearoyl-CoA desaturase (delta-9 desaturase)
MPRNTRSIANGLAPEDTSQVLESGTATAPAPAPPEHDPYPFGHDPWWGKGLLLAIIFLPLFAMGYAVFRLWGSGVGGTELLLFFGLWTFTGLGISVGFHRMLTHRAFTAKPVTKFMLLVAGTMAVEGPPAGWAATHLRHHAKADKPGDPHSPLEGFWHAHTGWMLHDRMVHDGVAHDHLMTDPIVRWVSKTWIFWTVFSLALPAAVGFAVHGTWMGALDGFVWGGLLRVFMLHHTTWSVNSIGHMFGSRPFRSPDRGANNPVVALFGWGEGWHNNHHAFPRAAYIGMRWWQIDMGAWLIAGLKAIHQVKNVWNPTRDQKAERRVRRRDGGSMTQ